MLRLFYGLLVIVALGGCQYIGVKSTQISGIKNLFFPTEIDVQVAQWTLRFGGYSVEVTPVTVDGGIAFVNNNDVIKFDGWMITKVSGLESFTPAWEIAVEGGTRRFTVNGYLAATHQCQPWVEINSDGGLRYEQQCFASRSYTNSILVDNLGQVTDIKQVVDSTLKLMHLRLIK